MRCITALPALVALTMLTNLAGCGYTLSGKVVRGEYGSILFVPSVDEQFQDQPVPYASVKVYRDPDTPNRELIGTGRSNRDGEVSVPLKAFGAGWMVEQWEIEVVTPGYETVASRVTLPSSGKKLKMLIVLVAGRSMTPSTESEKLWEQYEQFR